MANENSNNNVAKQLNMESKSKDDTSDGSVSPVRKGTKIKLGFIKKIFPKGYFAVKDIHLTWKKLLKRSSKDYIRESDNISPLSSPLNRTLGLIVTHFPTSWSKEDIRNFILEECQNVRKIEILDTMSVCGIVRVKFYSHVHLVLAKSNLQNKEIDGNRLIVIDEFNSDKRLSMVPKHIRRQTQINPWDDDPQGLYGLRLEFLSALNISPPIDKWVHVFNFHCEKPELMEVMGLAGDIIICTIINGIFKMAKVMYSHPLEAVQAVSMLNGRVLLGHCLGVTMDKPDDTVLLPEGLVDVGPGLGKNGKAVRNIALHYDRFLQKQSTMINTFLFISVDDPSEDDDNLREDGEENHMNEYDGIILDNPTAGGQVANEPPVYQNLVFNPLSIMKAKLKDGQVKMCAATATLPSEDVVPTCPTTPVEPTVKSIDDVAYPSEDPVNPPTSGAGLSAATISTAAYLGINLTTPRASTIPSECVPPTSVYSNNLADLVSQVSANSASYAAGPPGLVNSPPLVPRVTVHPWAGVNHFASEPLISPVVPLPTYPPQAVTSPNTNFYQNQKYWNPIPPVVVAQNTWMHPNLVYNPAMPAVEIQRSNLIEIVPSSTLDSNQVRTPGVVPENYRTHLDHTQTPESELTAPHPPVTPVVSPAAVVSTGALNNINEDGFCAPNTCMDAIASVPSSTVVLHNFPSCRLEVLLEKLSRCGRVMSLKSPSPHHAVATFSTPEQAAQCIQMYDGFIVGEYVLRVTYA